MARTFVRASAQYGANTTAAPATGYPCTLHCLFRPASTASVNYDQRTLVSLRATNSDTLMIQYYHHTAGSVRVRAVGYGNGATIFRTRHRIQTLTNGVWYACTATFTDSTTYEVYVDAAAGTIYDNTGTVTLTTLNRFDVGSWDGSVSNCADGDIAEVAVWDAVLTLSEITALSARVSPQQIRPGSLVAYAPLNGKSSPEPELVGGLSLTLTNSPAEAANARVFKPRRKYISLTPVAATAPSITALSAISITATSAQPRISYS